MQSQMQSQIQNDLKTADNIGRQFLQAFFNKGTDISNFYGNDSILTFESEVYIGTQNIVNKLSTLNLNSNFTNYEAQPSVQGILLFVSGTCCLPGENNQLPFMRIIFLANANGSYYVKNDIYKITFG